MMMPASWLSVRALLSLMEDCDWLTQTVLQWMSQSPTPWVIDREMGDLRGSLLGGQEYLSYLRYNVQLDSRWLKKNLNIEMSERRVANLYEMDRPENVEALAELGAAAAKVQVKDEHFPASFDHT